MRIIVVCAVMLAAAGLEFAQGQLTPRQLWYKDDAEVKPRPADPAAKAETSRPPDAAVRPDPPRPKSGARAKPVRPVKSVSQPKLPYGGPVSYVQAGSKPLLLRYSLLRIVDGSPEEVGLDTTFRSGDQVGVRVEGNQDGFLYVVSRGSSGNWTPLFPSADIAGGENRLRARQPLQLPSKEHAFVFNETPGVEQLFIIYSAQPVDDLDALIYSLRKPEKPEMKMLAQNIELKDGLVSKFRDLHSRDLVVERISSSAKEEGYKPENAVYVENRSGGRVVADIPLTHK